MGFFDFFDDANEQFCREVKEAWNELWDSDTAGGEDSDPADDSSSDTLGNLIDILCPSPVMDGGQFRRRRMAGTIGGAVRLSAPMARRHGEPAPGTPVYCNLAVAFEHTGIYIGDDEIVHLNGDGEIEIVSPREFVARWDGLNPAISIYYAAKANGAPLCRRRIADRAGSMAGGRRDYDPVFDNCHQFTCGCISGDFENPCNFFWMVEMEIRDKLGPLTWAEWDC